MKTTLQKRQYRQRYYEENREVELSRQRQYYRSNTEAARAYRMSYKGRLRERKFGLTEIQYQKLWRRQQGLCANAGCATPLDQEGREHHSVAIDHCHLSNEVRGLLCAKCNKGLGHFDDDPAKLRGILQYLERT